MNVDSNWLICGIYVLLCKYIGIAIKLICCKSITSRNLPKLIDVAQLGVEMATDWSLLRLRPGSHEQPPRCPVTQSHTQAAEALIAQASGV